MESAYRTKLAKAELGLVEQTRPPTLKEFAVLFTESIMVRSADRPHTIGFYQEKIRRLLEYPPFPSARLDDINEQMIERYVQYRHKSGMSPASINRELATLKRMLRQAMSWRMLLSVPEIKMLAGERTRTFVLTSRDEARYMEAAPQPLRDMAVVMLDAGLRIGETVHLEWSHVRLKEPCQLLMPKGKGKFARVIPLTERAIAMLWGREGNDSKWVFPSDTGNPYLPTSLAHIHTKLRSKLRMSEEFVIHSFRHTFATRFGESTKDAFALQKIAGHQSIVTSQRYVHPSIDQITRGMEKFEEYTKRQQGEEQEQNCKESAKPKKKEKRH